MLTVLCFQKNYNKKYENLEEETQRFLTFVDNQKKIFKHNQLHKLGSVTYKLKSNQFADLTHKEFLDTYIGDDNTYDKRCFSTSLFCSDNESCVFNSQLFFLIISNKHKMSQFSMVSEVSAKTILLLLKS